MGLACNDSDPNGSQHHTDPNNKWWEIPGLIIHDLSSQESGLNLNVHQNADY